MRNHLPDEFILDYWHSSKIIELFFNWRSPDIVFFEFANSIRISAQCPEYFMIEGLNQKFYVDKQLLGMSGKISGSLQSRFG